MRKSSLSFRSGFVVPGGVLTRQSSVLPIVAGFLRPPVFPLERESSVKGLVLFFALP
jgi:hypothetical protein